MLSEREDEHVQVARRAGEATHPRELGREVLDDVGREYVLDLPEQRACAPDGHAEVVEKLRVQIGAETRLVGHEDAEQRQVNLPGADVRADRRGELHAGRRDVASFRRTNLAEHHAVEALRAGLDSRATLDHRHEPLEDVFVAAQARQRDHRGQRLPGIARHRQPGPARLDPQACDRLVPVVEDLEQRPVLLCVGLRE